MTFEFASISRQDFTVGRDRSVGEKFLWPVSRQEVTAAIAQDGIVNFLSIQRGGPVKLTKGCRALVHVDIEYQIFISTLQTNC